MTEESTTAYENPDKETLRKQLEIQWLDHFQTRQQTWKPLEIQAAMVLAVVAADIKLDNILLLILFGGILVVSAIFGVAVTMHHRKVQSQKFKFIHMFERKLGLHNKGYMDGVIEPVQFTKWGSIFNPKKLATPAFILIMQMVILTFSLTYIAIRVYNSGFNS